MFFTLKFVMYDIIIGRSEADKEKYGTQGTIFLGRHYVKMGQTTSLSNNVYVDVSNSHVVFVVGKRGSGKCLHGDTLITLRSGLEVPIKHLFDDNEQVIALNHQLKLASSKKSGFYIRQVGRLLHIKLRSGKEIKLTPEHPLLTVKGWIKAENLQIGSRIATPRALNFFGNVVLPEHEIKILAYLIAEGHIKKGMFFTNYDDAIVKDLRNSLKLLAKGTTIKHEKTKIRDFLESHNLYSLLSKEKFVPEILLKSTKNNIASFINRLFSCDGIIYKTQKN